MQDKRKNSSITLLWQIFSVLAAICGMLLIMLSFTLLSVVATSLRSNYDLVVTVFQSFAQIVVFTLCIFNLRSIIDTIMNKDPFTNENVKRFKMMTIYLFISGIMDFAANLLKGPSDHGLKLLKFNNFFVSPTTVVLIVAACFTVVMAEIFRMAVNIKNENDLTI